MDSIYLAITESGSVAVPIDASLPAADICELLDRAGVRMLIFDEARRMWLRPQLKVVMV